MAIDKISQNFVKLALFLDQKTPGLISEIWIEPTIIEKLKASLPGKSQVTSFIYSLKREVNDLQDERRKVFLREMVLSLEFQITSDIKKVSYGDFTAQAFRFPIHRVSENEIQSLQDKINSLEQQIGLSRQQVFKKYSLTADQLKAAFEKQVDHVRSALPKKILDFPDKGFSCEVATKRPWSAFNYHTHPFISHIVLNADTGLTRIDLRKLACHEGYGGHHSELSNKDKMLLDEGRGEHGIVIVFSPQVFVSEAIAEGIYVLLNILDQGDKELLIAWTYDRFLFALQNLATHLFFEDGLSRKQIDQQLQHYMISDQSRRNILNFSTDIIFGRYAPVYYSAYTFLHNLYQQTSRKDELITTLFTKPCTPSLLTEEFKN